METNNEYKEVLIYSLFMLFIILFIIPLLGLFSNKLSYLTKINIYSLLFLFLIFSFIYPFVLFVEGFSELIAGNRNEDELLVYSFCILLSIFSMINLWAIFVNNFFYLIYSLFLSIICIVGLVFSVIFQKKKTFWEGVKKWRA